MSEKTPREFWISDYGGRTWIADPSSKGAFLVREVIEEDTSCESKMDAAVQMLTEKNAEIAKLKEALKVAIGCINEVEMHFALRKNDIAVKEINTVQTRIKSILGEKEGGE